MDWKEALKKAADSGKAAMEKGKKAFDDAGGMDALKSKAKEIGAKTVDMAKNTSQTVKGKAHEFMEHRQEVKKEQDQAEQERIALAIKEAQEGRAEGLCGRIELQGDKLVITRPENRLEFELNETQVALKDIKGIEFVPGIFSTLTVKGFQVFSIIRFDLSGQPRNEKKGGIVKALLRQDGTDWARYTKHFGLDDRTVIFLAPDIEVFDTLREFIQKKIDEVRNEPAVTASQSSKTSPAEMLSQIKKLHEQGILSDAEYAEKKAKYIADL